MDSDLIPRLARSINTYLDCKQRADWLWQQIDLHLHASYLAESVGDTALAPKHLRTVTHLLVQANEAEEQSKQHLSSARMRS